MLAKNLAQQNLRRILFLPFTIKKHHSPGDLLPNCRQMHFDAFVHVAAPSPCIILVAIAHGHSDSGNIFISFHRQSAKELFLSNSIYVFFLKNLLFHSLQ